MAKPHSPIAEGSYNLEDTSYPALLAAADPNVGKFIDDFLWDYMGDPTHMDAMPRIARQQPDGNEYAYDQALEKGFTEEGTLVLVRRSMGGAAMGRPQKLTHFVATADIHERVVTEWRINDVRHTTSYPGSLRTELVLAQDAFDVLDGERDFKDIADPVRREIARRAFAYGRDERDAQQARVIMTSQGVWFKPLGGSQEVVKSISGLVRDREAISQLAADATQSSVDIRKLFVRKVS